MSKRQRKMEQKRKQAIWNFFEDGIWEIYFGLAALWIGLVVRFYWPVWSVSLIVPLIFVPLWLKEKITLPQLSKLKITVQKRKGVLVIGLILLLANIVVLLVMKDEPGLTGFGEFLEENDLVIASMVTGSISLYLAYAFGFKRLYSYGVLLFIGFFAEAWLFPEQRLGLVSFAGFIIMAAGVSLVLQFLRRNPNTIPTSSS